LRGGGYLAKEQTDPAKALDGLFADLKKEKDAAALLKKDYDTLAADKKKADDTITTLKKDVDTLKKDAADALTKIKKLEADVKAEQTKLAAESDKLKAALGRVELLSTEKKGLEDTIVAVGDKVGLNDIDPVRSRKPLFQRLDDVVNVAGTKDPQGRIAASLVEIRTLNGTLKQRWAPEVMLGYWMPLLAERSRKEVIDPALQDVERVKNNANAPLDVRGQAATVEGLALRNRGDFDRARLALSEAVRGDVPGQTWKPIARDALKALSDPSAYYLPRAESLRAAQRYQAALEVLAEGLKVFPEKNADLLALRSQAKLDQAVATAEKLTPDAPGVKEASDDAAAAIKAGAEGAGNFAAARIADALGQRDQAVQLYRKALGTLPEAHPDSARSRLGLARLLLQGVEFKPPIEPMPKEEKEKGAGPAIGGRKIGRLLLPSLNDLLKSQLPPPEDEAAIKEAIRLADEVLARKDIDQFPLLKAQALSVKGLATQALNTYVKGLKPHLSQEHYEGLKKLVDSHPMQRQPDRLRIPHPLQAQKHFAQGLSRYYACEYLAAEKEFIRAIENFDLDARYHFFLGLSRLAQNKPNASEDFEQGARLEADNRPAPAAVNAALERIQGRQRELINAARDRIR
jgi:hypothetical protein